MIAAALAGGAAAIYAALFSFAVKVETIQPRLALAIYAGLPRAAGRAGDLVIANSAQGAGKSQQQVASVLSGLGGRLSGEAREAIKNSARQGLAASPLDGSGLRQLALIETRPAVRSKLLELADNVSRRDLLTALQLSEVRVRQGDVEGALKSFNRALIVSDRADSMIFPSLARGTADPQFRGQIERLLRKDPNWGARLVRWAVQNPQDAVGVSRVVASFPRSSDALALGFGQQLVDELNNQGNFAAAFAVYDAYSKKPQNPGDLSRFDLPPIDWRLNDNIDNGSRVYRPGTVEIFVEPSRTGDVMQMLTRLAPGAYVWKLRIRETNGPDSRLKLGVTCAQGAAPEALGELQQPLRDGLIAMRFAVSAQCPFQTLTIGLSGGNEAGGALLDSIAVSPQQFAVSAQQKATSGRVR